jgi:hypothetical protein
MSGLVYATHVVAFHKLNLSAPGLLLERCGFVARRAALVVRTVGVVWQRILRGLSHIGLAFVPEVEGMTSETAMSLRGRDQAHRARLLGTIRDVHR